MKSTEEKLTFNTKELEKKTSLVLLAGDLDMYTLPQAKEKMQEILNKKVKRVIIDLANVNYIDSSGLGFFIGTLKKMKEYGGELKLVRLTSYIEGIFKLIQLHQIINIYETMEEAFEAFDKQGN